MEKGKMAYLGKYLAGKVTGKTFRSAELGLTYKFEGIFHSPTQLFIRGRIVEVSNKSPKEVRVGQVFRNPLVFHIHDEEIRGRDSQLELKFEIEIRDIGRIMDGHVMDDTSEDEDGFFGKNPFLKDGGESPHPYIKY